MLHYIYQILTAFNMLRIMSEVVLLLPNTDQPQQVEDYVRGCTTSSEYWQPSTGWRLSQRLHYFYQILTISTSWRLSQRLHYCYRIQTDLNRLNIMSEVALLLPNTDLPQQFEDYVRGCTTSSEYWPTLISWKLCQKLHYFWRILTDLNWLKIMSDFALLLANSDRLQQVEDYVRYCTTSSEYWPTSTDWRICQSLHHFLRILTDLNRLKIIQEVALLLANTDRPQQAEDYVRGCTTSSEYWSTSTGWILCQRLHYFYQILTTFNKLKIMSEVALLLSNTNQLQLVEGYVRGCTTSTKYWPHSTSLRLRQRLYYF
jgi:hypothetical protein